MKVYSQQDFLKLPVLGLVPESAPTASAPTSPVVGQLWFDTSVNQLKVCTNATGPVWTQCDNVTGGTAGNVADGDKGEITIASGVWTIDNTVITPVKIGQTLIALGDTVGGTAGSATGGSGALRSLGTTGNQAAAGNDARLSDTRVPTDGSVTLAKMAANSVDSSKIVDDTIVNADLARSLVQSGFSLGTASPGSAAIRALGLAANYAMPGDTALSAIAQPTGAVNMNNQKIVSLGTPTTSTDAVTKAYADGLLGANDAMVFKGGIDCSASPNYPAADAGWVYRVTVAGKIGGASGPNVEVNDQLTCLVDSSAAGTHATVGSNWLITQTNIDGAVTGPASSVSTDIAVFSGTTGKVIADSGVQISTDGNMIANSNSKVPTEAAVKTYAQPYDADLFAIAALVSAADKMPYSTGVNTWAMTALTAFSRTLLASADAAAARLVLGLGAAAVARSYSFVNPALTANVWSGNITHNLNATNFSVGFSEVGSGEGCSMDWKLTSVNTIQIRSGLSVAAGAIAGVVLA